MAESAAREKVKIRAHSPGRYPIVVVEIMGGGLRTVYFETGYDLVRSKEVEESWLRENAIGRHEFIEVDPPRDIPVFELVKYARRELLGEA